MGKSQKNLLKGVNVRNIFFLMTLPVQNSESVKKSKSQKSVSQKS
jgi:hypothetical protein